MEEDRTKFIAELRSIAFKYVLTGAAATAAESATFPMDLTKTRLQIQGEKADGSTRKGMLKVATDIARKEGFFKLWQGVQPAILRQLIYTGVRMGAYEQIREHVFTREKDGTFPLWKAGLTGLSAGVIGQLVASPMDLIKVQMQMEGKIRLEGHPPRVHSMGHALRTIIKAGGLRGLWAGWVPNVQRAALVNMGDLATYDRVKQAILHNTTIQDNWVCHTIASACSGLASATLGTPTDVIKTRVMNQPRDKNGKGLYYKSSVDCLIKTVKKEGFFSLYKGFIPIWTRMAPWSLVFWITYEKALKVSGIKSF